MTGQRAFLEILREEGVELIFGNPGTTELALMDALANETSIRYVLALQEAAVVAMADGYAQAGARLGVVNLHAAPGLGNGIGMLYDAQKSGAPLLVTAGQHDQVFGLTEPNLWAELPPIARPFVKWSYEVHRVADLPRAMRRAIKVALTPPTGPVFLSIPGDVLLAEAELDLGAPTRVAPRMRGDAAAVARAAERLAGAARPVIFAGDAVAKSDAFAELVVLAELLSAPVYMEGAASTAVFPSTHPLFAGHSGRLGPKLRATLSAHDVLFSVGADLFLLSLPSAVEPMPEGLAVLHLDTDPWEIGKNYPEEVGILGDPKATLPEITALLSARLGEAGRARAAARRAEVEGTIAASRAALRAAAAAEAARTPIRPTALMAAIGAALPANAVVIEETLSSQGRMNELIPSLDARSYFGMRGGGIGWGLPAAIGAKLAQPERPLVALIGDGSALYTCQGLWTAANQGLRGLVFVILNNGGYRILKQRARDMRGAVAQTGRFIGMNIAEPAIDYPGLARSFGLAATRVGTLDELRAALAAGLAGDRPHLIDVVMDQAL